MAGTLLIFPEAFAFNLVGASGHFRMIFDFMNYDMEKLALILELRSWARIIVEWVQTLPFSHKIEPPSLCYEIGFCWPQIWIFLT